MADRYPESKDEKKVTIELSQCTVKALWFLGVMLIIPGLVIIVSIQTKLLVAILVAMEVPREGAAFLTFLSALVTAVLLFVCCAYRCVEKRWPWEPKH